MLKQNKNKKGKVIGILITWIVINIIIFLIDYYNLFSKIGGIPSNLNYNLLSITIGNSVVILLYAITYKLIDKKQYEKENNKRNTSLLLLKETYVSCEEMIKVFDDEKMRQRVSKKCNWDLHEFEDPMMQHLQNLPFTNDNSITSSVMEGIITPSEYRTYIRIKKQYRQFIFHAVSFPESYDMATLYREAICMVINVAMQDINDELPCDLK